MLGSVGVRCDEKRLNALYLLATYGQEDGSHHKAWVIDQVARILAEDYDKWVEVMKEGEDGPDTYSYDVGIAP